MSSGSSRGGKADALDLNRHAMPHPDEGEDRQERVAVDRDVAIELDRQAKPHALRQVDARANRVAKVQRRCPSTDSALKSRYIDVRRSVQ
jgi:hypothetical protein